jgi:TRAP-type C4-dicarboxylate transport system permease small subunit
MKEMKGKKRSFYDFFNRCFKISSLFFFVLMLLTVLMQVFFRYVLKSPLTWIEELSRMLLIWTIFSGSVVAQNNFVHPRIEFFINLLPVFYVKKINILIDIVLLVFCGIMVFYGLQLTLFMKNLFTPTLGVSLMYLYGVFPISAGAMAMNQLKFIKDDFRSN